MADKDIETGGAAKKSKTTSTKRSIDVKPKVADKPVIKPETKSEEIAVSAKPSVESVAPAEKVASVSAPVKAPRSWRSLAIKIVLGVVALVIVVTGIFAILIYGFSSSSPLTYAVSGVIPYPAERVNGHFVSYHDFLFEVSANQKAYVSNAKLNNQTAPSWTSAAGKKLLTQIKQHALTKLEDDTLTAQLATKYKITVSNSDVNTLVNTLYTKYGGKDTLLKTLSQIYGWNLNDLKGVIYKQLLAQKVQTAVTSDKAIDAQTKAKTEAILTKLKGGADFATLAKQDSQASDASGGGDLGTVAKGQVEDSVYTAASALQPGSLSDVIKTQYGYQILKVIDKSDAGIHLQHILIENISFNDYFAAQEKAAKVHTFIKA